MKLFIFLISFIPLTTISQVNNSSWGVSDTIITITKTTDFGVVHDYIEIFNNSGQDLQMRWKCLESTSWPAPWVTNFSDTEEDYYDVENLDSANFTLLNPPGWDNKLIIGVDHSSYVHADTVSFKVWPIDTPENAITIHYVIIITESSASTSNNENSSDLEYIIDHESSALKLKGDGEADIVVYSMTGQVVYSETSYSLTKSEPINLSGNSSELLFISVSTHNNESSVIKILL